MTDALGRMHRAFRDDLDAPRRTGLVAYSAFAVTVAITRGITRSIRADRGPFRYIFVGPVHVHHYLPGIALLVIAGAIGLRRSPRMAASCAQGAAYGTGLALVADELPMLVKLRDVYWTPEGAWRVKLTLAISAAWGAALAGRPLWRAAGGRT